MPPDKRRPRSSEIRSFLLHTVSSAPSDVIARAVREFGLSRQALHRHMSALVREGLVLAHGQTRRRLYELATLSRHEFMAGVASLDESVFWRTRILPLIEHLPANAIDIWHYGCTEMVNNVIDHSGAEKMFAHVESTAISTSLEIIDNGVGIFSKIRRDLGLEDERHAVLELAKGKLTTDPDHHTGEGNFFTSRMFDTYSILSGGVYFLHKAGVAEEWIMESEPSERGTLIQMTLTNDTPRTAESVFEQFTTSKDVPVFSKTVVPVKLLRYGEEKLVSRSQAKRLLARLDRFEVVILDFAGIDTIGQAFADEVFRVFGHEHPHVQILPINMSESVRRMIARATAGVRPPEGSA